MGEKVKRGKRVIDFESADIANGKRKDLGCIIAADVSLLVCIYHGSCAVNYILLCV
jgi:hypothetical protein